MYNDQSSISISSEILISIYGGGTCKLLTLVILKHIMDCHRLQLSCCMCNFKGDTVWLPITEKMPKTDLEEVGYLDPGYQRFQLMVICLSCFVPMVAPSVTKRRSFYLWSSVYVPTLSGFRGSPPPIA